MKKGFKLALKRHPEFISGSSNGYKMLKQVQHDVNRKGFTLVELSIVLVIIGLLISGLLVGQSMIKATKIQAFVRQIQQFEVAASNFKVMYNGLPGDSTYYGGDGDGLVETDDSEEWSGEMTNYWSDLSGNGMQSDDGTYTSTFSASNFPHGGPNSPTSKIGENAGIIVFSDISPASLDLTSPSNLYMLVDCSDMTVFSTLDCDNAVYESEALAADAKMDDGVGTSGDIVIVNDINLDELVNAIDGTEIAYDLAADDLRIMIIKYGISNADLE